MQMMRVDTHVEMMSKVPRVSGLERHMGANQLWKRLPQETETFRAGMVSLLIKREIYNIHEQRREAESQL